MSARTAFWQTVALTGVLCVLLSKNAWMTWLGLVLGYLGFLLLARASDSERTAESRRAEK